MYTTGAAGSGYGGATRCSLGLQKAGLREGGEGREGREEDDADAGREAEGGEVCGRGGLVGSDVAVAACCDEGGAADEVGGGGVGGCGDAGAGGVAPEGFGTACG